MADSETESNDVDVVMERPDKKKAKISITVPSEGSEFGEPEEGTRAMSSELLCNHPTCEAQAN